MAVAQYIQDYYQGERQSAVILLVLAVAMMTGAYISVLFIDGILAIGFASGLLALSGLQVIVSLVDITRSLIKERSLIILNGEWFGAIYANLFWSLSRRKTQPMP